MHNIKNLIIVLSVFIITSCGGGGGGGSAVAAVISSFISSVSSIEIGNSISLTWSSTDATSCSASGGWTGTKGTSGTETVEITQASNTFSLTCTGDGGASSVSSVSVEGYRNIVGITADGYMSGATIFIDENDNYIADTNESSSSSDTSGAFTIKYSNGTLYSLGGQDADTQTQLDDLLMMRSLNGHSTDSFVISPVTSIMNLLPSQNIYNLIGIDSSINIDTTDPVARKGDGGIYDYLYEKGNQLSILALSLKNISNSLNTSTDNTYDYFKAIADEINTEFTTTSLKVDIETEAFITKVIDNIITGKSLTISDESKANTIKALKGVIPIVDVKVDNNITIALARFSFTTLQDDIVKLADGSASSDLKSSYSSDGNILSYIATDQSITINNITSDPIAVSDIINTDEDIAATINVLSNDSYVSSASISLTATNGSSGSTTVSNNNITYTPNADFNGSDLFSYTISQGGLTSTAIVSVTVNSINDAPSIDIASTLTAAENQTSVATIDKSDVDGDSLTLSMSGTDASSFSLSSEDILTFVSAPDYETKNSYSIIFSLTDGTITTTKNVTVSVTNVNDVAPVITSGATFSSIENQTSVGTIIATDVEGDALTFSISGTDFEISSSGVITFKSAPDFETKSSYTATVTVSDGVNSTTQTITVAITDKFETIQGYSLPTNIKVIETE